MVEINFKDENFPNKLREIDNPPKKIYAIGNVNLLNENLIAIIGSRNNTMYGEKWTKKFCSELIKYNLNIVSGMALGIDSIAHKVSIENGNPTIAVLPCGFENIYPKENIVLYNKIITGGGLIISEYEPNTKADSKKFLQRNRIVAGISIGVLVVEAAYRSGTSVTAKLAKAQKKKVFCVPGSLDNKKSVGTNNLIKEGAILVNEIEDIISQYNFLSKIEKECKNRENLLEEVVLKNNEEKMIYQILSKKELSIEQLERFCNIDSSKILRNLTILEIRKIIKRTSGGKYKTII